MLARRRTEVAFIYSVYSNYSSKLRACFSLEGSLRKSPELSFNSGVYMHQNGMFIDHLLFKIGKIPYWQWFVLDKRALFCHRRGAQPIMKLTLRFDQGEQTLGIPSMIVKHVKEEISPSRSQIIERAIITRRQGSDYGYAWADLDFRDIIEGKKRQLSVSVARLVVWHWRQFVLRI